MTSSPGSPPPANQPNKSGPKGSSSNGGQPKGYSSLVSSGATFAGVDQGIDFTGDFDIFAIGDGVVTLADQTGHSFQRTSGSALLIYKLDQKPNVPNSSQYVYVAELIQIANGIKVGSRISQGDVLAHVSQNPGTEIGWARDGTNGFLCGIGIPTPCGESFNNYVQGLPPGSGSSAGSTTGGVTGSVNINQVEETSKAAAFSTYLQFPGVVNSQESMALQGERSLMNDQPLLPMIEQLCKGSLRRFQSMPNGNFFAFYPDYFGGLDHRTAYWEISDLEIIDGRIALSDDPLATHVFTVGDTVGFWDGITTEDKAQTSGVVDLMRAWGSGIIEGLPGGPIQKGLKPSAKGQEALKGKSAVISFLKKYGARPYYEEDPMIRSPYYELFVAFQRFALLWSSQFMTTFQLTYMPELFPGGIVAFPDHGIQMFVEEVDHIFDYQTGFVTNANLTAPAAFGTNGVNGISEGMVRSFALSSEG